MSQEVVADKFRLMLRAFVDLSNYNQQDSTEWAASRLVLTVQKLDNLRDDSAQSILDRAEAISGTQMAKFYTIAAEYCKAADLRPSEAFKQIYLLALAEHEMSGFEKMLEGLEAAPPSSTMQLLENLKQSAVIFKLFTNVHILEGKTRP